MLQRFKPLLRKTALKASKPMKRRARKSRPGHAPAYLAACKGEPCYLNFPGCRLDPEDKTVVPAHQNQGKGMGLKTHDRFTVPACHYCHALYDQSGVDRNIKRAIWDWAYNQWEDVRALKMGGGRMMRKEIIGDATLFLGDCREIMASIEAGSVDMIWTDPPYGHANGEGDFLGRRAEIMGDGIASKATPIANDSMDDMRQVVDAALTEASRVLKPDCCCCCCCCGGGGGPRPTFAWLALRMDSAGLSFFHSVIWDKNNPGVGWRYRRQHEMVMVAHRRGGKLAWNEDAPAIPNVIRMSKPRGDDHPNLKPTGLVEIFIQSHTKPGAVVLDPFMGSGTTGVACAQHSRKFIGIELDEKHFDTACRRLEAAASQARLFA